MLKRTFIKKICLAFFCLLVLLILYLFPKVKSNNAVNSKTLVTVKELNDVVYLLDNSGLVSRVPVSLRSEEPDKLVEEIITYMTVNSIYSNLLPNGFNPLIPEGTKIISTSLSDKNLKLNLSSDFLSMNRTNETKVIEALIYSLTSIEGINSITLLVDGEILTKLPNSKDILPNPLDRSYGINKQYDIDSIKDTTKTTVYYLSKNDNYYYYTPVTKVSNDKKEKIEIIINELKSSPIYETSLMSYLNSETTLKNYNILNSEMILEFNNAILSGIKSDKILEEVTYAVNLSIKDSYDVEKVTYEIDKKKIATFDIKDLE